MVMCFECSLKLEKKNLTFEHNSTKKNTYPSKCILAKQVKYVGFINVTSGGQSWRVCFHVRLVFNNVTMFLNVSN